MTKYVGKEKAMDNLIWCVFQKDGIIALEDTTTLNKPKKKQWDQNKIGMQYRIEKPVIYQMLCN